MIDNPWLERRVLNYAHQGGAREAPSSTLFAMRQALEVGAHAIELDVHATLDHQIVVCHDATVDATTDDSGAIADYTLAELVALDNAYWFIPGHVALEGRPEEEYVHRGQSIRDPAFRICPLRTVLEEFPGVFLNLDIKQTAPTVRPYEQLLADLLQEFGRTDDVIVASFHDEAVEAFAAIAPEVHTSAGTQATAMFWAAVQGDDPTPAIVGHRAALQVPPAFGDRVVIDERFVRRAHDGGLAVHAWTIDDPVEAARLIDLGVDGIMTDCPTPIAALLSDRGVAYTTR